MTNRTVFGSIASVTVAAALAASTLATGAMADGTPGKSSVKDAPAAAGGRTFAWSWNFGATSDYIFRGISQSRRDPALQAGVDMTYGIFYAGAWGSHVNFGSNLDGPLGTPGTHIADIEVDFYAGIKPVLGPVTFDLGVIYYSYFGGKDRGPRFNQVREQDYVEGKLGASAVFVPNLTTGVTAFFSPQYNGGQGFVTTVEGTIAYELPKVMRITPTIGATLAGVFGDANDAKDPFLAANGKDSYMYWNVGLNLGIDKLSLDFRYWDTNISNTGTVAATSFCKNDLFGCDGRFVATAKVTF